LLIDGDTLPDILYVPSMILQDTARDNETFCVDMKWVIDTSGVPGRLKVFYCVPGSDTVFDSIPPYPGVAYDSVRTDGQRLSRIIEHGTPISLVFWKGIWSDTTSMFTDTVVQAVRDIGSFVGVNDAMRIPNMVFPKTVLRRDASVGSVDAPAGRVDSGQVLTPQSNVWNRGQVPSVIPVHFTMSDSLGNAFYSDSSLTIRLAPGGSQAMFFKDWTASGQLNAAYDACSWTALPGDMTHANDTARAAFELVGVDEPQSPHQQPQRSRLQNPCRAVDLEKYVRENGRRVEVMDASGRRWPRGDFSSLPSGVYLLRFSQEPKHTEEIVLQQ
jgi:hypothetical protein